MDNSANCQSLFAFRSDFFKNIFNNFRYPWEIIPHIQETINIFLSSGIDGYTLLDKGILIGKDTYISDSAHIEAPAIIGHGCQIRHGAYLRGSVILGNSCVVGNSSEIKNSILMDRAQAPHFNYVGDSILGEGAHLGAGAICSNLRSDGQNISVKSEDVCIDTGLRKLGAILGDRAEIGCGSVLCPGSIIGKNTVVYPLTMTRGIYPCDSIVKHGSIVIKKDRD